MPASVTRLGTLLSSCALQFQDQSLLRLTDFARAHARLSRLSSVGEKQDARPVDARGGPAIGPTIDFGSLVAPDDVVGKAHGRLRQRKTFAPQQLQLTRDAAAISTDPAARSDHAVTWNIDRHRIVVHCITDGPRSLGRSRSGAQSLVADHSAARDFLELMQNFLLERTGHQSEVDSSDAALLPLRRDSGESPR